MGDWWPCCQWDPVAVPMPKPQELTFFVRLCYICHGFKNDIAISAFAAYKRSMRNGRQINLEAEKWYGRQQLRANCA